MGLLKEITPNIIKAYGRKSRWVYQQINDLEITASGITADSLGYVVLPNGKKLFSYPSDDVQKSFYRNFLSKLLKKVLVPEALNAAIDVSGRYFGPKEGSEAAIKAGKLYDVNKGDVVIEAGAYVGIYAVRMSELVGFEGRVYAIEAVPENFHILKRNVEENNIKNIIPINMAIWKHQKTIKFYRTYNQIGSIQQDVINTQNFIELPADTLDNIMAKQGVSKIDVARIQLNGVEPEALEGMTNLLKSHPKLMVAGMYKKDGVPVQELLIKRLEELGYTVSKVGQSVLAEKLS